MKKLNYLALFTFTALILSSCGGLNKMQEMSTDVSYTVTPEVLEEHADQVDVKIDVRYPAKYFNKKAIVTATPVLTYEGGETAFEPKKVQGEKVEANNQVINFSSGGSVSYTGTVPFTEDMMKSDLVIRVDAELKGNSLTFDDYKIAEGVIATPQLVEVDPMPIMVGDKYQQIVPDTYQADIHYIINRYNVRMSELKEDDVAGLSEFIKESEENERVDLKGVELQAYASPDGELDLNDRLAQNRQESAKRYFDREMSKAEVEAAAKETFLAMNYTAEDWEGFKELMENSDIQDKELILRVLSMYSDPVVREREIKNISEAFEVIAEEVLPELRRSKFVVNVDNIGHTDAEIKTLWTSDPDSLKLEEILYAATLYEDLDTKLAIYKKASENHSRCFRAANNIGYVYVLKGDADNAEKAFEEAKALMDNDIVNNNLGAVALMKGDLEKAEQLLLSSVNAGDEVSYNLGIINIMKGDYDAAMRNLGSTNTINSALVKILKDDFNGALATINKVEGEDAKKYYVKAIAAANQDNESMALDNLKTAVSKSSELKARAKVDMEFAKYFENETFKGLVE
jgi:tetratricopeptide (TPR) repeat protein